MVTSGGWPLRSNLDPQGEQIYAVCGVVFHVQIAEIGAANDFHISAEISLHTDVKSKIINPKIARK